MVSRRRKRFMVLIKFDLLFFTIELSLDLMHLLLGCGFKLPILELSPDHLKDYPLILDVEAMRGEKFVDFIDDISIFLDL